jgi:Uma2 family endonuclease
MSVLISKQTKEVPGKRKKRKIPAALVKETIDGIPFYYAGYRSVINKTKKLEDIMADSGLQTLIKNYLNILLIQNLDLSKFHVFVGEVGNHLDYRNNMGLDVTVYDRKVLTPDKITEKYIDVAPEIVVEIDVNVELQERNANLFEEFVLRKVRRLHAFGTEKIIWIFTKSKTVIVARPTNIWEVLEWDAEVELLEGITFNIARYLEEEGIKT